MIHPFKRLMSAFKKYVLSTHCDDVCYWHKKSPLASYLTHLVGTLGITLWRSGSGPMFNWRVTQEWDSWVGLQNVRFSDTNRGLLGESPVLFDSTAIIVALNTTSSYCCSARCVSYIRWRGNGLDREPVEELEPERVRGRAADFWMYWSLFYSLWKELVLVEHCVYVQK